MGCHHGGLAVSNMILRYLDNPVYLLFCIPAILLALTFHEYAHAYAADKMGDPTAKNIGRLTINPLKHLNLWGTVCMLFVGFGWANPVPVNTRYFKNPRKGMALVSLAGPLSNLIIGIITALVSFICNTTYALFMVDAPLISEFLVYLGVFMYIIHMANLSLCVFNLIPCPPLDGYRILSCILPPKTAYWLIRHEKQFYMGLLLWLLVGSYVVRALFMLPMIANSVVLSSIVSCLSIGNLLSWCVTGISRAFFYIFSLILSIFL